MPPKNCYIYMRDNIYIIKRPSRIAYFGGNKGEPNHVISKEELLKLIRGVQIKEKIFKEKIKQTKI